MIVLLLLLLISLRGKVAVIGKADDAVATGVGEAVTRQHPLAKLLVAGRDSVLERLHAEGAVLVVGVGRHALDGGRGEEGELVEAGLAAEGVEVVLARGRDEGHRLGQVLEVGLAVVVLGVLEQELDGHRGPVEGVVGREVGLVDLRG